MWPFKNSPVVNSEVVENSTLSFRDMISQAIGTSHSSNRDIYSIYGYQRVRSFRTYYQYYEFNDYANRIITAIPKSCWRDGIEVKDGNDDEVLVDELKVLDKVKMFRRIEAADTLNRIGAFSVLYVGVPDGLSPSEPLGKATNLDEVYFSAFSEDGIIVTKYDSDILSVRFGMPEIYSLTRIQYDQHSKIVESPTPIEVHWSRIVHMAEGALDSGLQGIPALSSILNRLQDLDKTIGGSAEAYFRNVRGKIAYKADKDFGGFKTDADKLAFDTAAQQFTNGWKDQISLVGIDANSIDTPHADPASTVMVALQAISGQTGIPIRILTGEGAGQLAGNEDKASYNQLISDRQNLLCEEWVFRIMEILTEAGLLEFKDEYTICWPELESRSDDEAADIAVKRASAFQSVTAGLSHAAVDGVLDIEDVLKQVLDMEFDVDMDALDDSLDEEAIPALPFEEEPGQAEDLEVEDEDEPNA